MTNNQDNHNQSMKAIKAKNKAKEIIETRKIETKSRPGDRSNA